MLQSNSLPRSQDGPQLIADLNPQYPGSCSCGPRLEPWVLIAHNIPAVSAPPARRLLQFFEPIEKCRVVVLRAKPRLTYRCRMQSGGPFLKEKVTKRLSV
jgi:hypothetical protein